MGRAILIGLFALSPISMVRAQDAMPEGVVLLIGDGDGEQALAAANEAGGANWRLQTITARAADAPSPPTQRIEEVRTAYLGADFLRCVSRLADLSLDALLREGHRREAAQVAVLGAACARGADDGERSDALLRRAFSAELDLTEELRVTAADFQTRAENLRAASVAGHRVALTVRTRPAGASVQLDGAEGCARTPCTVNVLPGRHVLSVKRLGRTPRTVIRDVSATARWDLSLDPASSEEAQVQLGAALAAGISPDSALIPRVAAMTYGTRLVVSVWSVGSTHHAAIYDRATNRDVAQISASGPTGLALSVEQVVDEWRGVAEPTPLYAEPLFWTAIVAAAVAAGLGVFFALSSGDTRHDIVFRFR